MHCRRITLIPKGFQPPTVIEKIRFVRALAREMIFGNVNWVLFDHLSLARAQKLVPRAYRRPYAVVLYSIEAWCPLGLQLKSVLRGAQVRVAISNYAAQRIMTAHPDIGPVEVCHLALLPDPSENCHPGIPSRVSGDAPPDGEVLERIRRNSVLIVGRMFSNERHKGHDHLIDAWPFVQAQVPDAQLVVVGRGDDVGRLMRKAKDMGIHDSILFTGQVSDGTLHALYGRVALFAMPSRGEGFGLVYLEAMQHRLPCIGSFHDAAAEIIEDNVSGLLVDRSDPKHLVQAIVRLLGNESLRRQMGNAGYERVRNVFSFSRFRQQLLTALQPLTGRGAASCTE